MEKQRRYRDGIPERLRTPEGKEGQKLTFGFDFIFITDAKGKKHAICIEINGKDSGIGGIADVPDAHLPPQMKMQAEIRNRASQERHALFEKMEPILKDIHSGDFPTTPEGKEKILRYLQRRTRDAKLFKYAFQNPDDVEMFTQDKAAQAEAIPGAYAPRTWRLGQNPSSATGFWICKPRDGRTGAGIHILSNKQFLYEQQNPGLQKNYVVQEFTLPDGADFAPEELTGHAASMRFLMDFTYDEQGNVNPISEFAYQRVSPVSPRQFMKPDGTHVSLEDRFVVNKARGAIPAAASDEEIAAAKDAAYTITPFIMQYLKKEAKP